MPYIPPDAGWYLAELVMQFDIEGDETPLVHINTKLVRADSPEEAYLKATGLGQGEEITYKNTDGNQVNVRFRGLRDLFVVTEALEDGAELIYEEKDGLSEAQIARLVRGKS
jgi:hypothetical protein